MVKEIPDDAPSSLSEMTPFDFRVIERHPQERGTSELGDLLFPLTSRSESAPGSRSAAFYMGEARSLLSPPFRRKKAAMQAA